MMYSSSFISMDKVKKSIITYFVCRDQHTLLLKCLFSEYAVVSFQCSADGILQCTV